MYAVGGHDGINYLKTVERYNPETNEWTCVASMGARRGGVGVAPLGGCLYATGGYDGASNLNTSGKVENVPRKKEPTQYLYTLLGVTPHHHQLDPCLLSGPIPV